VPAIGAGGMGTGRFLMIRPIDEGQPQPSIRLTVNGLSDLRRLVPHNRSRSSP
jgi:hypothetical protein